MIRNSKKILESRKATVARLKSERAATARLTKDERHKAYRAFAGALLTAFEKNGLDHRSQQDRWILLILLADAVYGGKKGRPKKWTKKKVVRMRQEIEKIKAENPKLSSTKIYALLIKKQELSIAPDSLRRRLRVSHVHRNKKRHQNSEVRV